jgi:hypothetical protein
MNPAQAPVTPESRDERTEAARRKLSGISALDELVDLVNWEAHHGHPFWIDFTGDLGSTDVQKAKFALTTLRQQRADLLDAMKVAVSVLEDIEPHAVDLPTFRALLARIEGESHA